MLLMRLTLIVYLLCVCWTYCFPTRNLNLDEQSQTLAWQAWLLVDDQNNQNKQTDPEALMRRRITPKSVFIAPTFRPESLPPCPQGYSSDSMGRCIQIFKLDEDAHLDFLLNKLNEKFGDSFDEEPEDKPTTGPLQFNIPLGERGETAEQYAQEEGTDIAIVVAPTHSHYGQLDLKFDKRDQMPGDELDVMSTTVGTTDITSNHMELSTISTTESTTESTTTDVTTTETNHVENNVKNIADTMLNDESFTLSTSTVSNIDVESTTTQSYENTETTTELSTIPTTTSSTSSTPQGSFVRFPQDQPQSGLVKFPDSVQQETLPEKDHQYRDTSNQQFIQLFNEYIHNRGADVTENERHVFTKQPLAESANLEFSNGLQQLKSGSNSGHHVLNHRNRDKNSSLFVFPPRWNPTDPQKLLVLRFSRKHPYVDPQIKNNPDYYRSVPTDDLSYFFGNKPKRFNHT